MCGRHASLSAQSGGAGAREVEQRSRDHVVSVDADERELVVGGSVVRRERPEEQDLANVGVHASPPSFHPGRGGTGRVRCGGGVDDAPEGERGEEKLHAEVRDAVLAGGLE